MNHIRRNVRNPSLPILQAASEYAGSHGGLRTCARALAVPFALALAGLTTPSAWAADGADGANGTPGLTVSSGSASNASSISGGGGSDGGHATSDGDNGGSGGQGGAGLWFEADAPAVYTNEDSGTIRGGAGGTGGAGKSSGAGGSGGSGGVGVLLTAGGSVTNNGVIKGQAGGAGGNGGLGGFGGSGGTGGVGVLLSAGGSVANNDVIKGGTGGAGAASGFVATGGTGGTAVWLTAGGSVTNSDTIQGGAGGTGTAGGAGGAGGVGVRLTAGGSVTNSGTIQGGVGSADGLGGVGILLTAGGSVANDGVIKGGTGGAGQAGGVGVLSTDGGSIVNNSVIKGGAGGTGGAGGVAISGANLSIVNSSKIIGGMSGDGSTPVQADAVRFTSGANSLEIQSGSIINGTVDATAGTNTLVLGGTTDDSFAVSGIGAGQQYRGFTSYEKTGASTWTLTGTTTAVTPWTLKGGTLAVGSDTNLGDASGGLAFDGGTLEAATGFSSARGITLNAGGGTIQADIDSTTLTLSGPINGAGSLTATGTGTLTLSGANTYTGGTNVYTDVNVASTGALGTGPVLVDGGVDQPHPILTFEHTSSAASLAIHNTHNGSTTFADSSSAGHATIVNDASGSTAFTDASSAGSATFDNQGHLMFADTSSAGNATLANSAGGLLEFVGSPTADGATVVNKTGGTVDLGYVTTLGIGSLSGAGNVNLGSATLTLGGLNRDDTINGVIADGGLIGNVAGGSLTKIGTGTLTLNGVNTYTGLTTVDAGTLEVGDAATPTARIAGDVLVNAAGTLRGHGTVGGAVNNNGIVRPGGSIGTLTIAGDYTQLPGGTLMFDISPTGASQLKVGGTATLGGTLALLYGPGTYTARSYQLISAASVVGAFAAVTTNAPSGVAQDLPTSAGGLDLNLAGTGSVAPVIVAPTNATLFGAASSAALRESQRVNGVLLDRLGDPCLASPQGSRRAQGVGAAQGSGAAGNAGACLAPSHRVWIQASGTDTRIDGNHGAPDVRDQRYGFLAGVDRNLKGGWTVGIAGGYSHADVTEDGTDARAKLDTLRIAAYAGKNLGRVNVAGTVGYAYDFLSTTRPFGTLGQARGSGHGQEFNAGVQASLPWTAGRAVITPRLGLRYAYLNGFGLNESGPTSQNLGVDGQTLNSLQPYAGVTLDYPLNLASERPASVQARLGYAYETQSMNRDVAVTAADGTGFVIPGTRDSRGMLTAGLGATLPIGKTANAYVRYDTVFHTGNVSAQSVQAGVDCRF